MTRTITTSTGLIKRPSKAVSLLRVQTIFCILFLCIMLLFSKTNATFRDKISVYVNFVLNHGISVATPEEITRFTGELIENIKVDSKQMLQNFSKASLGRGGEWNEKPQNCLAPRAAYYLSARLYRPVLSQHVTSAYGCRIHPITNRNDFHTGIDLAAAEGNTVSAALNGIVSQKGTNQIRGNYVEISHGAGIQTSYSHLQYTEVEKGQPVYRGEAIGAVGQTGYATGPHLHFEIKINGTYVNPDSALMLSDRA